MANELRTAVIFPKLFYFVECFAPVDHEIGPRLTVFSRLVYLLCGSGMLPIRGKHSCLF